MHLESARAVSYDWSDFTPLLSVYDGSEVRDIDLGKARHIDIAVSKTMRCIGRFEGDEYIPCPYDAVVDGPWRQCEECARPVIPDRECIFEPKCDGSLCGVEFCSRPHVVYLAFAGNMVKVGMTSERRMRKRAVEQGADAYAVIYHARNRLDARNMEKEVSRAYGIRQAHTAREMLSRMRAVPDRNRIKISFTRAVSAMEFLKDIPELEFLEGYPIELPLRRVPVLRPSALRHVGRVIGVKGRYLVYESSGIYAVDIRDLLGRTIKGNIVEHY